MSIPLDQFAGEMKLTAREMRDLGPTVARKVRDRSIPVVKASVPISSGELQRSIVSGREEGDVFTIGSTAPHAFAVDFGRRRDETGRLIGSVQARRGFTGPFVKNRADRIKERVALRELRRAGL